MKLFLDLDGVRYFWNKVHLNFANLSDNGKVPANLLPSYVDDVLEYGTLSVFPETGEYDKIYVAQDTNLTYRWSGTRYVEISQSLALGKTSTTAYPGNKGKANELAIINEVNRALRKERSIQDSFDSYPDGTILLITITENSIPIKHQSGIWYSNGDSMNKNLTVYAYKGEINLITKNNGTVHHYKF